MHKPVTWLLVQSHLKQCAVRARPWRPLYGDDVSQSDNRWSGCPLRVQREHRPITAQCVPRLRAPWAAPHGVGPSPAAPGREPPHPHDETLLSHPRPPSTHSWSGQNPRLTVDPKPIWQGRVQTLAPWAPGCRWLGEGVGLAALRRRWLGPPHGCLLGSGSTEPVLPFIE